MGARRLALVVSLVFVPASVWAGHHNFEGGGRGAFSAINGSTDNVLGLHLSAALRVGHGKPWVGLVVDGGADFLGLDGGDPGDRKQVTIGGGGRVTLWADRSNEMFLNVLGAWDRQSGGKWTTPRGAFAVMSGLGYDRDLGEPEAWALRFQLDFVKPLNNDLEHDYTFRFAVGLVYKVVRKQAAQGN